MGTARTAPSSLPDHRLRLPTLREMWALAFSRLISPDDRFVTVLTTYLDESGTDIGKGGSTNVVVAGFCAQEERWLKFDPEWDAMLEAFKVPFHKDTGRRMFHMADCIAGWPPWSEADGWNESRRSVTISELVRVAVDHAEISVAVIVPADLFERVMSPEVKRYLRGPYGLAANLVVGTLGEHVRTAQPDAWIRYVLESGVHGQGEVIKVIRHNIDRPGNKERFRVLGSMEIADKVEVLPCQAADILAWELHKEWPRSGPDRKWSEARKPLQLLRRYTTVNLWQVVGEDEMRIVDEALRRELLA